MVKNRKANVILDRQFLKDIVQKLDKSSDKLDGLLTVLEPSATYREVRMMDSIEAAQWYCIAQLKLKLKEQSGKTS
jgi:hypothetical protein